MNNITFLKDTLFEGTVSHLRYKPIRHSFQYNFCYFWFSLEEKKHLKFFKINRFSLFSFYDLDHGTNNKKKNLYNFFKEKSKKNGLKNIDKICVFCLPRLLGYVFNPITVFVCFDQNLQPKAVIYQVNNTFNERHSYFCKINEKNLVKKKFYVSPFFKVEGNYTISFKINSNKVCLNIIYKIKDKKVFEASFSGISKLMTDKNLLKFFFKNFFQNFKVTIGIYFEALKLFLKGAKYIQKPKKPKKFFSIN